jgi:beta-glucosidase
MTGSESAGVRPLVVADGPHGVRVYKKGPGFELFGKDNLVPTTLFPSAAGMAATFNDALLFQIGEAIGNECNMHEGDILLAPGINLKRSPLGGRNFEYYSEDPYLTGRMGSAYVNGVQSTGVGACMKHFALNEQETNRRFVDTIADKRTMHELYLQPFKMLVDHANPVFVMSSYNRVNGHYTAESQELLIHIIRNKWGYKGAVMSDWNAVQNKVKSIKNGMNVEMPGRSEFEQEVHDAINNGSLTEEDLDQALEPVVRVYERAIQNPNLGQQYDKEHHHKIAQKVVEEAIVLLENDGILPILDTPSLAVIGAFAKHPRINGGGSVTLQPYKEESPYEELKKEFSLTYAPGYDEEQTNEGYLKEVQEAITSQDVILFFTGTTTALETEGQDRPHMNIPQGHLDVFDVLKDAGKPIVVILMNGSAVNVTPFVHHANAMLETWFMGGASGTALVSILTGRVNPSGRLSETFPLTIEHTPHYKQFPIKQDEIYYHGDIINIGYRYYDTHHYPVRYPFGFGLSYTTFRYDNINLSSPTMMENETVTVSVDVTNVGSYPGKEVVQLYVEDVESFLPRPKKELRNFKKIALEIGETKTVTFTLSKQDFAVYVAHKENFYVEPGTFVIHIGPNVTDIKQRAHIDVQTVLPYPYPLTKEHPVKHIKTYHPEATNILADYPDFPWYQMEEPTKRVLYRLVKQGQMTIEEFDELIIKLTERKI